MVIPVYNFHLLVWIFSHGESIYFSALETKFQEALNRTGSICLTTDNRQQTTLINVTIAAVTLISEKLTLNSFWVWRKIDFEEGRPLFVSKVPNFGYKQKRVNSVENKKKHFSQNDTQKKAKISRVDKIEYSIWNADAGGGGQSSHTIH